MAYHYPPPAEWQTYQTLVAGFARVLYNEHTVEEYGRNGQRQHGVDVFARDHAGKNIGLQCKWTHESLDAGALAAECDKARKFSPKLNYFVLWTTARRDVNLQDLAHSLDQSGAYPFSIGIRFWDDAIEQLNRMYSVASAYYAEWLEEHQVTADHDHRRKLRIAFDRPAFTDPIHLERNFEDLLQAVKDTLVFLKAGLLYDRYDRTLIAQALPFSLLSDPKYVEGLAKVASMLADLEMLLQRSAAPFGAQMMTDSHDVEQCDRLRRRIVRQVKALSR
ncbi:hypothetical protein GCM10023339_46720 [Alloalcanivorax gelatiniphagus]